MARTEVLILGWYVNIVGDTVLIDLYIAAG
jgi:hypothetical protein